MHTLYRVIAVSLLSLLVFPVSAQESLAYGETVIGQTGAQYTFSGAAGDLIRAEAIGITFGVMPTLTLRDSGGNSLATNDTLTPNTATLTFRLPADGDYGIDVGNQYNAAGDFVLTLNGAPEPEAKALASATAIEPSDPPLVFSFAAPAEIRIGGAHVYAEIRNATGQRTAVIDGLTDVAITIDQTGSYELAIQSTDGSTQVTYRQPTETAPTATPTPTNTPTNTPTFTPSPTNTQTFTPTDTPTNTPTDTPTFTPTYTPTFTPTSTDTPTYTPTNTPTDTPTFTSTPTETPTNTPTNTPTATPTNTPTFTPTDTPTDTPTNTPTATPTATPTYTPTEPITSNVANYQFVIPLDGQATTTGVVSYPLGDQQNRVFYAVSGLNSNPAFPGGQGALQITASCTGTGTDAITFSADGQTFGCGDTLIARRVTFNNRSGSILITATGGDQTNVRWTLTGSAARLN